MVTNPTPGSSQHSTSSEGKKKGKKKKRKSKSKKNGEVGLKAEVLELQTQLTLKDQELRDLSSRLAKALDDLKASEAKGLGPREQVKLRNLFAFHGRILNAQLVCDKDRETIKKIIEEFQYILGKELKPHT